MLETCEVVCQIEDVGLTTTFTGFNDEEVLADADSVILLCEQLHNLP
jgi:hypothetical protein